MACWFGACAAQADSTNPLHTVSSVDLNRYQGTWYEIARVPNRFQDHCHSAVTASYQLLDSGDVRVTNRCLDQRGEPDQAIGLARVVDLASRAKLEVSFVSLFGWHVFWGDYWIIELDPDYHWVIVGEPSREFGWILARTPSLPDSLRNTLKQRLRAAGYEPQRFVDTRQDPE